MGTIMRGPENSIQNRLWSAPLAPPGATIPLRMQKDLGAEWARRYDSRMEIVLPTAVEQRLDPSRAALHLAIGLFTADEATLGQAAEVARMSQSELLRELGRRRISLHYGPEGFRDDLATIDALER